jgi:hypothetical protein
MHESRTKITYVFNISKKLRGCDSVLIGEYRGRVLTLIEKNPLLLWNAIHKRGSKISLVRTAYYQLKCAVKAVAPDAVDAVEKKHKFYKAKRNLN